MCNFCVESSQQLPLKSGSGNDRGQASGGESLKNIGKSSMWLVKSDNNILSLQDIWIRLRLSLPITEEMNSKLLVRRIYDQTVMIVRGCANSMFIFRLIDLYSAGAVGKR